MITAEDLFPEEFEGNELQTVEEPENAENPEENEAEEEAARVVKPKRITRNPQPKLNLERLKGPRGLGAVGSYFDRVKFKGRGYEDQDLNVLLKTYEYWCHRLFPKYPFEECITKIENLGSKKGVVTHIKRIRMDLSCEDDAITNEGVEEEPIEPRQEDQFDALVDAPTFDEINEEQAERIRLNRQRAEKLKEDRLKKMRESEQLLDRQNSQGPHSQSTSNSGFGDDQEIEEVSANVNEEVEGNNLSGVVESLNQDQEERIRLNREKAEKLRQERLSKIRKSAQSSLGQSSRLPSNQNSQEVIEAQTVSCSELVIEETIVDNALETREVISQERHSDDEDIEDLLDKINSAENEVPTSMDFEEN